MLKSIKFKLILIYSLIGLIIVVFLPIGRTGADSSTPEIKIDTLPEAVLFDIENFKPGDWAPRDLTIQNNGNQDFSYNMRAQMKSGSEKLYNQLLLKVEDQTNLLFEGKLKDFKGLNPRPLARFTEEHLKVTVEFPYESGNEFQGLQTVAEFIIYAEGQTTPPDPPDDGDPPDPPDDGDPPDPPGDGDPPDPPDDGDPPDPPDDGDPPNPPTDTNNPPGSNEPPSTNKPPNGSTPTKPVEQPSKATGSLPQTGEENPMFIILSGFFIFLAGLGLLLIKMSVLPNPFRRG
ncbi:LPXTG cell wall anchor domain-containing protein [Fictibacillus sp. 23RED33]|uniref:LPXTG cell wall anchor domain-containing protein n=1 Tax=Fictibacillus sp. 23RED33 TaxID=2745879 RepID=UPI0018CC833E|nr:LPXTG cell wall anchor domain-containing protein [Fictibacillus sp. 23RED33]MBH0173629.1 LPXTG cell wall anchor domain-containing protein [Fictibacillus sp. 23RED33]